MKTMNNPTTESTELQNTKNNNEKSSPRLWQSVLVGGVPGLLIGAGIGAGVQSAIAGTPGDEAEDPKINDGEIPSETLQEFPEIQVAHSVTDDMSFSEAFAAARNEVGPGGAYVWHGQVYGTYRGDDAEWQDMSAEERAEHSQAILSQVHPAPYTPTENEPTIVEVTEDNVPDEVTANATEEGQEEDVDIHIVGVEQGQTDDGTLVTVGYGAVDGHYAEFVDTDGDGEVDTVLIDHNNNQELDEGEVHGVAGSGITIDDMVAEAQANTAAAVDDALYGEMPDYTNDADTSSYV